ncbi:MAG: hypothetical protein WC533_04630 [Candidatus Pacearchaeota archaeon]
MAGNNSYDPLRSFVFQVVIGEKEYVRRDNNPDVADRNIVEFHSKTAPIVTNTSRGESLTGAYENYSV